MASDIPAQLAKSQRACLVAPAGFGKTDVIARAVAHHTQGRQLILTHTHAGVRALRERLARYGAAPSSFHLDTVAGFALRYAASLPRTSGLDTTQPMGTQWNDVYGAAATVLSTRFACKVIKNSFAGVFVDEYQDCTAPQHGLVRQLADLLPTRVVGDPLQGIFEFGGGVVDWDADVFPVFNQLDDLEVPWRWRDSNPELGEWLLELRANLLTGSQTDISSAPLHWVDSTHPAQQLAQCKDLADALGSVVALRKWANACHLLAQKLGGIYTSMEEVESRDLQKWARALEKATSHKRAHALMEFASKCMTGVGSDFSSTIKTLKGGKSPKLPASGEKRPLVQGVLSLLEDDDLMGLIPVMESIERASKGSMYRLELWNEMAEAIKVHSAEPDHGSLAEAAWVVRDRGRHTGRRVSPKVISRTLLVKGLEFDHCVVLDASELGTKDLYVAMTRGSSSLAVLSEHATL